MSKLTSVTKTIIWGSKQPDKVVTVYFAPAGESRTMDFGESYTSEGFTAYEKAQFQQAFDRIASVSGLSFQIVTGASAGANADFQMVLDTNEISKLPEDEQFLGYFNPPGEDFEGVGVFNGAFWDRQDGGDLRLGGFGFVTIMHEVLHGLGLAHPHDDGGTSTIMRGVTAAFDDYGSNSLNQGIYTTMTYNSGYLTGPAGSDPAFSGTYGYEAGPMALDIAALQYLYGTSARNTGSTTYTLPDANAAGAKWRAIWDTAGTDTLRYDGSRDATIDLRPATLVQGEGAGGYISAARGIAGGFTIAHGVLIERAIGGGGDDKIIGNNSANTLIGGAGQDRLVGNGGKDYILGGLGNDNIYGNTGRDSLYGKKGADKLYGGRDADLLNGGRGNDILKGGKQADTVLGRKGNDKLKGGGGDDDMRGGTGHDRLEGGRGQDDLWGGSGQDTFVFTSSKDSGRGWQNRDKIFDFDRGDDTLNLRSIDANTKRAGNQAFDYKGGRGFEDAGDLKVTRSGNDIILKADRNGDGRSDFEIKFEDLGWIGRDDIML